MLEQNKASKPKEKLQVSVMFQFIFPVFISYTQALLLEKIIIYLSDLSVRAM